jgi:hypothetical protein
MVSSWPLVMLISTVLCAQFPLWWKISDLLSDAADGLLRLLDLGLGNLMA